MKLLTHNMLTSKCLRGVVNGFPLKINATEIKEIQVDYNKEFIQRIIPKVNWPVLHEAAKEFGCEVPLNPDEVVNNEEALKQAHHALLEIEVVNGDLVCPETGRKFPISDGIPNMLCNEDEV